MSEKAKAKGFFLLKISIHVALIYIVNSVSLTTAKKTSFIYKHLFPLNSEKLIFNLRTVLLGFDIR